VTGRNCAAARRRESHGQSGERHTASIARDYTADDDDVAERCARPNDAQSHVDDASRRSLDRWTRAVSCSVRLCDLPRLSTRRPRSPSPPPRRAAALAAGNYDINRHLAATLLYSNTPQQQQQQRRRRRRRRRICSAIEMSSVNVHTRPAYWRTRYAQFAHANLFITR